MLGLIVIIGSFTAFLAYRWVMSDNVVDAVDNEHEVFVKTGWNYDSLTTELYPLVVDFTSFNTIAQRMNLPNKVIPGKYVIKDHWSNRRLVSHLRSGSTVDVDVVLNSSIIGYDIFGRIAANLEVDSSELVERMRTEGFLDSIGFTNDNWPCLFYANTYRFNWATTVDGVFRRFKREADRFWTAERKTKAAELGLDQQDVVILASIVDAETIMDEEMKTIAGVYLNRLQKDWPLGADPTIRFLIHEEGRQRVLNRDLEIESPYNTYKNLGLPPGPILLPSTKAIDAVLNADSHDYMYFCAKADFSGYHVFAKNAAQHNRNAAAYRRELNRRNILR